MKSALHWDGHDNVLLQLQGCKTVLILPPEAVAFLGFQTFRYHAWTLDDAEAAAVGAGRDVRPAFAKHAHAKADVENHARLDVFSEPGGAGLPREALGRARVVALRPGDALYLPALWSHAVRIAESRRFGARALRRRDSSADDSFFVAAAAIPCGCRASGDPPPASPFPAP